MTPIIILSAYFAVLPHFESGSGVMLDYAPYHPVIIKAKVLTVEPHYATHDTRLRLLAQSYWNGSGPDTVRLALGWICDGRLVTEIEGRILHVPKVGDEAVFWIVPQVRDWSSVPARLSSDGEIWQVVGDSLPSLGCSWQKGRQMVQDAVRASDPHSQLQSASNAIMGSAAGRPLRCDGLEQNEGCLEMRVERWVKGARSDSVITVITPERIMKRLYTRGLYFLAEPDSMGRFRPADSVAPHCPVVGESQYLAGFRIERSEPLDLLVPVIGEQSELFPSK
jgi:hypothetical protein